MIPKIIHYCWFGKGAMPELSKKCINSWKDKLPEYEFVLWNEDNFDININNYVSEAYNHKKFAFVSDFVRLYSLYHYGGIYMDTDVELLRPLERFIQHRAFTGCQEENICVTGIIGAERKHPWIEELLEYYNGKHFLLENGTFDSTPNTTFITQKTIGIYSWKTGGNYQILDDDLHIYPIDYFCAKDWRTGKIQRTQNTYTIHHFAGSWLDNKSKKRSKWKAIARSSITTIIGKKNFESLLKFGKFIIHFVKD